MTDTQNASLGADEAALRRIIEEARDGFNAHDPCAIVRHFTPDAVFTNIRGLSARGTDAIIRFFEQAFATRLRDAQYELRETRITFLRPDVALAHVLLDLTGFAGQDGTVQPPHQEFNLGVYEKTDGTWRLAAFHNVEVAVPSRG